MVDRFKEKSRTRRAPFASPAVAPLAAHRGVQVRSRSILMDAAACFVATALGSLSPQALSLVDLDLGKPVGANVDPESGKFTDRVLIGGLRPLSWEEPTKIAPTPVFVSGAFQEGVGSTREVHPEVVLAAAKPAKPAPKKPERAPEPKAAEAAPAPVSASATAPEAKSDGSVSASQGVLAGLTPSAVSEKLAEKVWTGAKSVSGMVSGGLSWLGY